ncbi:hypothetical protein LJB89_00055 [Tyzzerella sp. OttesenSCG-928-J15]|nr:hypothetical protein [Tyzzerella sp. OttesenSCG-928-J15]
MSQNYQRYFMVLSEKSTEFTIRGKKALGKCILESKGGSGKVTFSVQNLKPGVICNAYIIAADNNSSIAIDIGRIIPDDKGKAEIKWECNSLNVEGSGLGLKDFNVAGMLSIKSESVNAPIIGYKDGEIIWRNNFKLHSKKPLEFEKVDATAENLPDEVETKAETVKYAEPYEKEVAESESIFPSDPEEYENYRADADSSNERNIAAAEPEQFFETIEEGPAEKKFKAVANKINEKLKEMDLFTLKGAYKPESEVRALGLVEADEVNMIFRNCSKIRPFKEQEDALEWVRITPNEIAFMPEEFSYLHKDYTISTAYRKFSHLILGRKIGENVTEIIFGMPDIYTAENEKKASLSALANFKCCDCSEVLEGKHGYWLKKVSYSDIFQK